MKKRFSTAGEHARTHAGANYGTDAADTDASEPEPAQLWLLTRLSDLVNRSASLDALCEAVVEDAGVMFRADCASVFLVTGSRYLKYNGGYGLSAQFIDGVERVAADEASSHFLSGSNSPLIISDTAAGQVRSPYRQLLLGEGIVSLASLPLINKGKHLGFMTLYHEGAREYSQAEQYSLEIVANMLALAVANSQFLDARQGEDKARDRFLSALSHELRTPLTSIMGFTQVIRKRLSSNSTADPRLVEQLEVLWTQAQRLNRLIDTFVDLSHIESGEFEIHLGKVELAAVLRAAVQQAVGQARTTRPVETHCSDSYIWIHADARRLEQVFTHIIANALKYSPPDKPVLVTCKLEQADSRVIVSVTDRGPGIPQHLRKDLFARTNPGDAQRSGGLGVGLFLTKTVVEAHGGQVSMQSSPNEGTTVTVVLPV